MAVRLLATVTVAAHAAVETYLDGILQAKPIIDGTAISPSLNLANLAV